MQVVGRDYELSIVHEHLQEALRGEGVADIISGDPGYGKSTIIDHLISKVDASSACIKIQCRQSFQATPLYCIRDALIDLLDLAVDATPLANTDKLYRSFSKYGIKASQAHYCLKELLAVPLDPPMEVPNHPNLLHKQNQQVSTLIEICIEISEKMPLIIIFEDVQWTDDATLQLIQGLAARVKQYSMYVVCSARTHAASALVNHLMCNQIELNKLGEDDIQTLVNSLLNGVVGDDVWRKNVSETSGGIPFNVVQLVKDFLTSHADLHADRDGADSNSAVKSVDQVLKERLEEMGEGKEVLFACACFGDRLAKKTIHALLAGKCDIEQLIERVTQSEFIRLSASPQGPALEFSHKLLEEIALANISSVKKKGVHYAIAKCLENTTEAMYPWEVIAHQYELAGDSVKAAECLMKAGDCYRNSHSMSEAFRNYTSGLELIHGVLDPAVKRTVRLPLLTRAATSASLLFGPGSDDSYNFYKSAESEVESISPPDVERQFAIYNGIEVSLLSRAKHRDAIEYSKKMATIASQTKKFHQVYLSEMSLANNSFWLGDIEKATRLYRKGVADYQMATHRGDDTRLIMEVASSYMAHLAYCYGIAGDLEKSSRYISMAKEVCSNLNSPLFEGLINNYSAHINLLIHEYGLAIEDANLNCQHSANSDIFIWRYMALATKVLSHCYLGEHDKADGLMGELQGIANEGGTRVALGSRLANMAECFDSRDDRKRVSEYINQADSFYENTSRDLYYPEYLRVKAVLCANANAEETRRLFDEAIKISQEQGTHVLTVRIIISLLKEVTLDSQLRLAYKEQLVSIVKNMRWDNRTTLKREIETAISGEVAQGC